MQALTFVFTIKLSKYRRETVMLSTQTYILNLKGSTDVEKYNKTTICQDALS